MALDTATKKTNKPKARGQSLTLRILVVNVIAPLALLIGLLYMGQYRTAMIANELETLKVQVQMFAAALGDNVGTSDTTRIGQMVLHLHEATGSRTLFFDSHRKLIADSNHLAMQPSSLTHTTPLSSYVIPDLLEGSSEETFGQLQQRGDLPKFPRTLNSFLEGQQGVTGALNGTIQTHAWDGGHGKILMTASAPVRKGSVTLGVVVLIRDGQRIERAMIHIRSDVMRLFLAALLVTILLSLYLAAVIGRPLRKLALAAEAVQMGLGDQIDIPDLSHRGDEIGHLSTALRDMTQALKDRMTTIERFAADVAHELKNPLTSLRSAVETLERVKKDDDKKKLADIINHDLVRMDRLITDISRASRLDAELSRDTKLPVDLMKLLTLIAQSHERGRAGARSVKIFIQSEGDSKKLFVRAQGERLSQVFDNLIANAVSFSPENGVVTVHVSAAIGSSDVEITVQDQGPGIPEGKEESIFERFYSERPSHEDYGRHSGLGLSIARQIVEAYNGKIDARNIVKPDGSIGGACFTVILPQGSF